MQPGRQKMAAYHVIRPQPLQRQRQAASFDPLVLKNMSLAARPDLKQPYLLTCHNKSMLKWAAEEQTNTVFFCPPCQR